MSCGGSFRCRCLFPKSCPIALAVFFVTALITMLAQSSTSFPVTVRVTDISGANVPDARVTITPSPAFPSDGSSTISLITNRHGIVTAKLNPGIYTACIMSAGFRSWRQQIKIERATSIAVTLEIAFISGPVVVNPTNDPRLTPSNTIIHELIPELPNAQHR